LFHSILVIRPERKPATLIRPFSIYGTFLFLIIEKNTDKLTAGKALSDGQPVTYRVEIPLNNIDLIRFKEASNPPYLLRVDPDVP
jgi:hypothetical protein